MSGPEARPQTRVLLLGGTAEARELAALLHADPDFAVLSSLAGRVANPRLPKGPTRIGGFGGIDPLAAALTDFDVLVDATHPFAAGISRNAAAAAAITGTPLVTLVREPWSPAGADHWTPVPTVPAAAALLGSRPAGRAMLTTGRQDVHAFADLAAWWFLIRVVDAPTAALPPRHELLRGRGPYTVAGELDLLRWHRIDVLVTKNSGGDLVSAKLTAARELGIEVLIVDRPARPNGAVTDTTAATAFQRIRTLARTCAPQ